MPDLMEFGIVVLMLAILSPLKFELHPCKSQTGRLNILMGLS